jgi:hypothetical protein
LKYDEILYMSHLWNNFKSCEISSSQGSIKLMDYQDVILPSSGYSSTLKMEAAGSSKMLILTFPNVSTQLPNYSALDLRRL